MARVLKGSQFYLHMPLISDNRMNHTCLCLPSQSWYSFTDPGRREGWVGLGESHQPVSQQALWPINSGV